MSQTKYLKYKNKYQELKTLNSIQSGGDPLEEINKKLDTIAKTLIRVEQQIVEVDEKTVMIYRQLDQNHNELKVIVGQSKVLTNQHLDELQEVVEANNAAVEQYKFDTNNKLAELKQITQSMQQVLMQRRA